MAIPTLMTRTTGFFSSTRKTVSGSGLFSWRVRMEQQPSKNLFTASLLLTTDQSDSGY